MANLANFQSISLYVGDLHPEVNEAKLFEIFKEAGPINSIRVCRDTITRRSLGYAYVNFHKAEDAERALDHLNYNTVKDRPIRIMWSQRDPTIRKSGVGNIFIKNLEKDIDHKALYDTFSAFGNILSCKVCTKDHKVEKDGNVEYKTQSLGYGFVHFETQEAAEQAIAKVNGMLLNGKKVYVGPFIKRSDRKKTSDVDSVFTNIYVKNLDKSVDNEKLEQIAGEYGEVQNAAVMVNAKGESKGFGFVNYVTHEAAEKAIEELNDKEQEGGKRLYVSRAQSKDERLKLLRNKYSDPKTQRFKGNNLYVKNLDDSIDDEKLAELFGNYGKIVSAKIMKDKGQSRGFGFVCFETPEEAAKALSEMNQKIIATKPLYVSLAQKKDDRRKFLETRYNYGQRMPMNPMQPPMGAYPPMMYPQGAIPPMGPRYQMQSRRGPPYVNMAGGAPMHSHFRGRGGKRVHGKPQKGYKITANARNYPSENGMPPPNMINPQMQPGMMMNQPHMMPQHNAAANLTSNYLADKTEKEQKQIIGDRLFPTILEMTNDEEEAKKVTGMFLEMETGDLLHLIDSPEDLNLKLKEAKETLDNTSEQE